MSDIETEGAVCVGKPVTNLKEHIKRLFQKNGGKHLDPQESPPACNSDNGFDVEFNFIEKKSEKDLYFGDYKSALKPLNRPKNRYSNVLPLEKTRLLLSKQTEEDSDYINASRVTGPYEPEIQYICTQGPLENTVHDFWRMVWEQGTTVIVMLTKEVENTKVKCHRYWPERGCTLTFGHLKVTLLAADGETMQEGDSTPSEFITRTFRLEHAKETGNRIVTQFQYIAWPDHGLPVSSTKFLELVHMVDQQKSTRPIVVHCSAGIGRSGTFCTVHTTLHKYRSDLAKRSDEVPTFNILQTVLFMRDQRPGMVQTREQYMFCYLAVAEETSQLSRKSHRLGLSSSLSYSS